LQAAHLRGAHLQGAHLQDAHLQGAHLQGAHLQAANLQGAHLQDAYLQGAHLEGANLEGANLEAAHLQDAHLRGAHLEGAHLQGANLRGANLRGAHLEGADLQGANNTPEAAIRSRQIVPQTGAFTAYKQLAHGYVACLEIPADAQRVGGVTGRKCRASRARVLDILSQDNVSVEGADVVCVSSYDMSFRYERGATVEPRSPFDPNPLVECASGIHFFLSYEEARDY
jgi:hypothetical protein